MLVRAETLMDEERADTRTMPAGRGIRDPLQIGLIRNQIIAEFHRDVKDNHKETLLLTVQTVCLSVHIVKRFDFNSLLTLLTVI